MYSKFSIKSLPKVVKRYFTEDINSRPAAGKKETITRNKVKMQKRYLNDSIKNLHAKFVDEKSIKISYDAFRKLKPFWVVENKSRDTCACKKCANISLQVESLCRIGELACNDETSLLKQIVCSEQYACMNSICTVCKNQTIAYTNKNADDSEVSWYRWEVTNEKRCRLNQKGEEVVYNVKVSVKQKQTASVKILKEQFDKSFRNHLAHKFNIKHQYSEMKKIKENLGEKEAAIVIDFSENYACKYMNEIQSFHFGASRNQVCLHTGVFYKKDLTQAFCTISPNTRHDPASIWAHLDPILMSDFATNVEILHFMSDSPSTQYRCAKNFFLFHNLAHKKYGLKHATWNFTEAGHGKSAADGVGGLLKRTADKLVNFGIDIPNAESFYSVLKNKTDVKMYYVDDQDILQVDKITPKKIKGIAGTMKTHQLTSQPQKICMRSNSCFCTAPADCTCFNITL